MVVNCEGRIPSAPGPMTNYLWPLDVFDITAEECAERIVDLPLCIVTDNDGDIVGMALTGGGMDLSWEIAEAYMRLGCYPPAMIRLAAICGRGADDKDKWIAAGMVKSIEAVIERMRSNVDAVKQVLAFGEEYERQQQAKKQVKKVTKRAKK